ncbi:DNA topoisomerase [Bacillus cereus]|uniref:DNA topoisomerase n=1 Tax=Bacillus cereus TaxID=1396 RepID=UPI00396D9AF6
MHVQTPTLALIVKREKEIENFKSEPFWEGLQPLIKRKLTENGRKDNESRLKDLDMANKIAAFCQGKPAVVKEMKTERKEFQPPLFLFNLSSLQATANKAFKTFTEKDA